jgi:hypothetical protein
MYMPTRECTQPEHVNIPASTEYVHTRAFTNIHVNLFIHVYAYLRNQFRLRIIARIRE